MATDLARRAAGSRWVFVGSDALVSEALPREFRQRGALRLVNDPTLADLVIGGAVAKNVKPFAHTARFFAHRIVCDEVGQDLDVWSHKAFLPQPALTKGDGPIAEYRRWASQFYAPAADLASADGSARD